MGESVGSMHGCQAGEEVGGKVRVGVGFVASLPSARDSERPPRIKPMEARAIMIPPSICHRFFILVLLWRLYHDRYEDAESGAYA